jgi:SAM-dependent methyltransferase
VGSEQFPKWDYKEYPKTLPADDLWGQVRRTIYGKPVSEEQIRMMTDAIVTGLDLDPTDVLLDIGCGNAALTSRLFPYCLGCVGVDFSEYLISVANRHFSGSHHQFIFAEALDYLNSESEPKRFSTALCFAVFSYLPDASARQLLEVLWSRFTNVRSVFLGNLPDRGRAAEFFKDGDALRDLDNPESQIGAWRSGEQIVSLCSRTGWRVRLESMPHDFYQSHYRYNAVLER